MNERNFESTQIKPVETEACAHPFSRFIFGHHLNLSCQGLFDKDIPEIIRFLYHQHPQPKIKSIDLSLNNIGDQGIADFAERNHTILVANFAGNMISDLGLAVFAYKNQTITEVNFSHNLISNKGIHHFAEKNYTCYSSRFSTVQYH